MLAAAKEPLTTRQMIEAMTNQIFGPVQRGRRHTPRSIRAILREINTKGEETRLRRSNAGSSPWHNAQRTTSSPTRPHVGASRRWSPNWPLFASGAARRKRRDHEITSWAWSRSALRPVKFSRALDDDVADTASTPSSRRVGPSARPR